MMNENLDLAIACPVCGWNASFAMSSEEDYHYGIFGRFELWCCNNCRHHFQYPMPTECDLASYYNRDYYSYQLPDIDMEPRGLRHRGVWLMAHYCRLYRGYRHLKVFPNPLLAFIGWLLVRKRRDLLTPRYIAEGTACDYGCGSCGRVPFLRYCGWQAEGIEFSEAAAAAGKSAGLTITHGSIGTLEDRPSTYDFIHSSHCVEHVPDVQRLFRAFYTAMKPGGTLAIEVPSADSAALRIYGHAYYYLGLPVHVHLFSAESLKHIATQAGFTNITISPVSFLFSHAESWLLRRDLRGGKASPRLDSHGKWATAYAKVASLGSFVQSIVGHRGDCLMLVANRPST